MSIGIDTEKLNAQIEKLEQTKTKLDTLFQNVKTDTNNLKDSWDSKTSEVVYNEFDRFGRASEAYSNDIQKMIDYLRNVVNKGYIEYETNLNKLIDTNIATN
jgi:uncharacterized protein YukE